MSITELTFDFLKLVVFKEVFPDEVTLERKIRVFQADKVGSALCEEAGREYSC